MNQNAITSAPCSFGILIDRGLGAPRTVRATLHIGLIFLGGPDDRESLAFASRMAGHPNLTLTLLRFLPGNPGADPSQEQQTEVTLTLALDDDKERRLDEACLEDFKMRWEGGEVYYRERVSSNAEETVAGIREMVEGRHDLYIVGRGFEAESTLTAGLTEWSECPELGPIGDLLSTSDFAAGLSVLVVQQGKMADGMVGMPDSPGRHVKVFVNNKPGQWQ